MTARGCILCGLQDANLDRGEAALFGLVLGARIGLERVALETCAEHRDAFLRTSLDVERKVAKVSEACTCPGTLAHPYDQRCPKHGIVILPDIR
jgi:hypothetical protein